MVTLINPPSKLHYLRAMRSPALLGCDSCKYGLKGRAALRGLGDGNYIPAGSTLNYQATYQATSTSLNPLNPAFAGDPNRVINAVQQNLGMQWKIVVTRSSYAAQVSNLSYTITLTLQTQTDYGAVGDIKNIVDGAFYNAAGIRQLTSNISVASLAQPGTNVNTQNIGPPVPPPEDDGSGYEPPKPPGTDWATIGLAIGVGVLGVFALKEIL